MSGPPSPQPTPGSSGRVAAVCPYIQVPVPGRQEGGYSLPPDPLKPQSLSTSATVNHARSKSGQSFILYFCICCFPGFFNKKYSRNSGDLSKEFIVENTLGTLTQKTFIQKLAVVKMMSIKWVYKVHDPNQEDTTI